MASVTINAASNVVRITAVSGAVPVGARIPTGGTTGQTLIKSSGTNYDVEWSTPSGSGDMVAATYDPTAVAGDAFDMANMVEAADAKIMTSAERSAITANTAKVTNATHTGDVTGSGALTIAAGAVTAAKTHADVQASLALADSAIQAADLATVATTGDYDDLSNKPTIPTVSDTAYGVGWNGDTDAPSKNAVYDKIETISAGAPEGTAVLSTGETGGTKFLREDGDGTCSWQTIAGGGDALVANPLSQFAATTSAQLAGVMSDETGSGALVFGTSPTITTPTISGNLTTTGLIDGRDVDADGTKLDGIEASADVTDETNVVAALDGATLTAVTVAGTDKVIVQDASDTDNIKTVTAQSIADLAAGGGVDTSGTPVANDFARFTDADTIEGRSYAEVKADLGLEIGTDVQAYDAALGSLSGLSLSAGDIIYATAADTYTRLAKGTANQVLTMNAGATAPEWAAASGGGGSFSSIETDSDITGASYDLTGLASYNEIYIRLEGLVCAGTNQELLGLFSDDNGSTFETSGYEGEYTDKAGFYTGNAWDNPTATGFEIKIWRLGGTLIKWEAFVVSGNSTSTPYLGYFDSGSAMSALQLKADAGSISGTALLSAWGK